MKALLALEDGRAFPCRAFTGPGEVGAEVVFNTGMTGYQEILTDPSYKGQMVTMTYPLIGNYGVSPEDDESRKIQVEALLVRDYKARYSNWRANDSLDGYLKNQGIMGVDRLDTRALTRHIRNAGAMRAVISTETTNADALIQKSRSLPTMAGRDLADQVSFPEPFFWENGRPVSFSRKNTPLTARTWRERNGKPKIVAFDFGIKFNILRHLEKKGFQVIVVPAKTDAAAVRALNPDGIFLSNGPGDPQPVTYAVQTVRELLGYRPMFGICLGHQIMGLAVGGRTFKLKFGHRGGNQPVKNLVTGRIEITSQNHGFAVEAESLPINDVEITHLNLNDNTVEGLRYKNFPAFSVQYHPEASPGPHDADYLFEDFYRLVHKHMR